MSETTQLYLTWCLEKAAALGKMALLLIWDHAPWHVSQEVRRFIRHHKGVPLQPAKTGFVPC